MILPYILATLTQHDRQKVVAGVDFQWSKNLWVHNICRAFELVFWARSGIAPAGSISVDKYGNITHKAFTVEAWFAFKEAQLRAFLAKYIPIGVEVRQIQLAPIAGKAMPLGYSFAIAFAGGVGSPAGASSGVTASLAVSGSNTLIIVGSYSYSGTSSTTGVTWNGSAFTNVYSSSEGYGGEIAMWAFVGASGTQNIVSSMAGTVVTNSFAATYYTGVNQSTTPDSSNGVILHAPPSVATSTTVVAANCWLMLFGWTDGNQATAGTGATFRQGDANNDNQAALFDSNGTVGTGSQSMTVGNPGNISTIITSWAPVASAVANSGFFLFM